MSSPKTGKPGSECTFRGRTNGPLPVDCAGCGEIRVRVHFLVAGEPLLSGRSRLMRCASLIASYETDLGETMFPLHPKLKKVASTP